MHLLRVNELADRLGVSTRTIYREAQRGHLRLQKIGRATVIAEIEARRFTGNLPLAKIAKKGGDA